MHAVSTPTAPRATSQPTPDGTSGSKPARRRRAADNGDARSSGRRPRRLPTKAPPRLPRAPATPPPAAATSPGKQPRRAAAPAASIASRDDQPAEPTPAVATRLQRHRRPTCGAARFAAEHDRPWRGASPRGRPGGRGRSAHDQQPLLQAQSPRDAKATRSLEPQIEALVRQHVRRGTVQVNVRIDREPRPDDYRLNEAVLRGYLAAARAVAGRRDQPRRRAHSTRCWRCRASSTSRPRHRRDRVAVADRSSRSCSEALPELDQDAGRRRARDGGRPGGQLPGRSPRELAAVEAPCAAGGRCLPRPADRAAEQAAGRSGRARSQPADIVREVGMFAERSDISEEIVRLKSHLEQFDSGAWPSDESQRPQARVSDPGNVPRNEHDRLEGQRRRDRPPRDRDQDGDRTDAGNDSERRSDVPSRCNVRSAITFSRTRPAGRHLRPSGAGKSTVVRELLGGACPLPLALSVSATTRQPRPGEVDGVDYFFLTPEEFARRREAGEFLECKEVFGRGDWYGTLQSQVAAGLAAGKWVLLEIDVEGHPGGPGAASRGPHHLRAQRLARRAGAPAAGCGTRKPRKRFGRRLAVARRELGPKHRYRYEVINRDVAPGRSRDLRDSVRHRTACTPKEPHMLDALKEEGDRQQGRWPVQAQHADSKAAGAAQRRQPSAGRS